MEENLNIDMAFNDSDSGLAIDNSIWKVMKDNENYEVSNRGKIRRVGNVHALASHYGGEVTTSKKAKCGKNVKTRRRIMTTRIFKDGKPYKVDGVLEARKVFKKHQLSTRQGVRGKR